MVRTTFIALLLILLIPGTLKSNYYPETIPFLQQDVQIADTVYFDGGCGIAEDPFLVRTAEQLNHIRNFSEAYFKQITDIDLRKHLIKQCRCQLGSHKTCKQLDNLLGRSWV